MGGGGGDCESENPFPFQKKDKTQIFVISICTQHLIVYCNITRVMVTHRTEVMVHGSERQEFSGSL